MGIKSCPKCKATFGCPLERIQHFCDGTRETKTIDKIHGAADDAYTVLNACTRLHDAIKKHGLFHKETAKLFERFNEAVGAAGENRKRRK